MIRDPGFVTISTRLAYGKARKRPIVTFPDVLGFPQFTKLVAGDDLTGCRAAYSGQIESAKVVDDAIPLRTCLPPWVSIAVKASPELSTP